jgi:two-component system alkaline phosphatase synthesis response regulator PhoP
MKEGEKKRILVLEDEKPLAHALELKLSKEGFEVVVANNGDRGAELLSKETFDVVLSDLIIPGTDGFGILEMIKNKKLKVPVIVMTNLNQEEDRKKAEDLGASDFFVKSNSTVSQIVEGVKNKIHSA